MYIYKGKVIDQIPEPDGFKKIKVSIEDVLLNFIGYEIKGRNIIISYSISYFNIPQNINEYEIDRRIDRDSLKKVIIDTVGDLGKFISLHSMNSKHVSFLFDAEKFIRNSTYPLDIVPQQKLHITKVKLNQKLPDIISQIFDGQVQKLLSSLMTTIIRNDRKYIHIFKHMNSWAYSKNAIVTAEYDKETNSFIAEIKNPYNLLYYYIK